MPLITIQDSSGLQVKINSASGNPPPPDVAKQIFAAERGRIKTNLEDARVAFEADPLNETAKAKYTEANEAYRRANEEVGISLPSVGEAVDAVSNIGSTLARYAKSITPDGLRQAAIDNAIEGIKSGEKPGSALAWKSVGKAATSPLVGAVHGGGDILTMIPSLIARGTSEVADAVGAEDAASIIDAERLGLLASREKGIEAMKSWLGGSDSFEAGRIIGVPVVPGAAAPKALASAASTSGRAIGATERAAEKLASLAGKGGVKLAEAGLDTTAKVVSPAATVASYTSYTFRPVKLVRDVSRAASGLIKKGGKVSYTVEEAAVVRKAAQEMLDEAKKSIKNGTSNQEVLDAAERAKKAADALDSLGPEAKKALSERLKPLTSKIPPAAGKAAKAAAAPALGAGVGAALGAATASPEEDLTDEAVLGAMFGILSRLTVLKDGKAVKDADLAKEISDIDLKEFTPELNTQKVDFSLE